MGPTNVETDVAMLWEEALNNFSEISTINIRSVLASSQQSIATIVAQQQKQLDAFKSFRHDKGKLDRLRSLISANADIIQAATKQIANAANAAFPPSSAILTAFTFVMTASKHVSDDYDMIEAFFDLMQSFLQRLSLLEGKIPSRREFQVNLIKVFSSILKMSALAYSYRAKGRLSSWASCLIKGSDPKLQGAYDTLHEDLKRLESATMMQTLRTAIDTRDETEAIAENIKSMQLSIEKNTTITEEVLEVTVGTNASVSELVKRSHESAHMHREILRALEPFSKHFGEQVGKLKSRVRRPASFERLKHILQNPNYGPTQQRLLELERASAPGVFEWIANETAFLDVVNNVESYLWIVGESGMGKSTAALKTLRYLEKRFSDDSSVSLICFLTAEREPPSLSDMLSLWCMKIAENDARYCETTLRDLRFYQSEDIQEKWHQLFESKFPDGSDKRLILILDGIQTYGCEDQLLTFFCSARDKKCEIQLIITGDSSLEVKFSALSKNQIELSRENIFGDLCKVAASQVKILSRLRKLRLKVRRSLIKKVSASADSFLYVAHTMRRLNGIGYEGPIRKELQSLPANISGFYDTLLSDCQENRRPEDREILSGILAWIAYARADLSVAEANLLMFIIRDEHTISMDEAAGEGSLGTLLRINNRGGAESSEDSDSDNEEGGLYSGEESEGMDMLTEDASNILNFQEPSLRDYFRKAITHNDPQALRCSPSQAHAIIFRLICSILSLGSDYGATVLSYLQDGYGSGAQSMLKAYARKWCLWHLLQMEVKFVSNEMAETVLESLHSLFTNKGQSLQPFEYIGQESPCTILQGNDAEEEKVLRAIGFWANRAMSLSSLTDEIREWFRPIAQNPWAVFIPIARGHIENWFLCNGILEAGSAFIRAHSALLRCFELAPICENAPLRQYCECFVDDVNANFFTLRSIQIVSNAFHDIQKTPRAYLGMGLALRDIELYDEAVEAFDEGLRLAQICDAERFRLLKWKGTILFETTWKYPSERWSYYLNGSFLTLSAALKIYRENEEAKPTYTKEPSDDERRDMSYTFCTLAKVTAFLKKWDLAVENIGHADYPSLEFFDASKDVIIQLRENNEHKKAMEVLKAFSRAKLSVYFTNLECHDDPQQVAKYSNEEQCLLNLYSDVIRDLGVGSSNRNLRLVRINIQLHAATFAQTVMNDTAEAKKLLRGIIEDPAAKPAQVERACYQLSEALFEDFRKSEDPKIMTVALAETKNLQAKLVDVLEPDFRAPESPIVISFSVMLRNLGPATELAETMQASFRACVDLLTDDTGNNDSFALRSLARVLGCVSGMEYEAEVALTAQLYVLNGDVYEKDMARQQAPGAGCGGVSVSNSSTAPYDDKEYVLSERQLAPESKDTENDHAPLMGPMTIAEEMSEGLLPSGVEFNCDSCRTEIKSWTRGGVYRCIYCTDCDICEECFAKRVAREKGELEANWRVVCPPGHRHVKAPVAGWRGVKNGNLRIHDDVILFETWLEGLQTKWEAYWDKFWLDKDI